MYFWKMNGAGNDFIIFNNLEVQLPIEEYCEITREVCERHMSVGADGTMVVDKAISADADFKMTYINSDGTIGEMCGNGARCICRYGYETGLSGKEQRIEVTSGVVTGTRIDESNYRIRLTDVTTLKLDYPIVIDGKTYENSYVELGDPGIPHAVVPIEGLSDFDENELFVLGRKMRYSTAFYKGANINFYEIIGEDEIIEKTYERGVEAFTYACGTGTGSMVAVLTKKGFVSGKNVKVIVRGGTLYVDVIQNAEGEITNLMLTGPTKIVCKGDLIM